MKRKNHQRLRNKLANVTRNNFVEQTVHQTTDRLKKRSTDTPLNTRESKRTKQLCRLAQGQGVEAEKLPKFYKKYPTLEHREKRMKAILAFTLEYGSQHLNISDVEHMLVVCDLQSCKKQYKCYEVEQVKSHLRGNKHCTEIARLATESKTVTDPLDKHLTVGEQIQMNALKDVVMSGHSFSSYFANIKYKSKEYQQHITSVNCYTKHLKTLYLFVQTGVKDIIKGQSINFYFKKEAGDSETTLETSTQTSPELPSLSIGVDSSSNLRRTVFKSMAKVRGYILLLNTQRIQESENTLLVSRLVSNVFQDYGIVASEQLDSFHHDSASPMCAGATQLLSIIAPSALDQNCLMHLFLLEHDKYFEEIGLEKLLGGLNQMFVTQAKARTESWEKYLSHHYNIRLSIPDHQNVTRKMIGQRKNLVWLLQEVDEYQGLTVLHVLRDWLEERKKNRQSTKTEEELYKVLGNGKKEKATFFVQLIKVALMETAPIALMVKLCQSDTNPANQHVYPFFRKYVEYFSISKESSSNVHPKVRAIYTFESNTHKVKIFRLIRKTHHKLAEYIGDHLSKYINKNMGFYAAADFLNIYSQEEQEDYTLEDLKQNIFFAKDVVSQFFERYKSIKATVCKNSAQYLEYFGFLNAEEEEEVLVQKLPDPLKYWQSQDFLCYNQLKTVAIRLYQIPSSTAMVERSISQHNLQHTPLRSCLKDETIEYVTYIRANLDAVEEFYQKNKIIPKIY